MTLAWNYWPFSIVPNPGEELVWADRTALKAQIERLGRSLSRHDAASLHVLWANFGAGKTHTLLYLKQQAEKSIYGSVLPFYCALPKGSRAFLDIYRAIVRAIPISVLRRAFTDADGKVGRENLERNLGDVWSNLPRCFQAIGIGGEVQQRIAVAWLQAETGISTRDLQTLSLLGRIRSTDDAVLALCGLVRLFNLAGHKRVLLMIDEFQRVEVLRRQQQDEINAGLHGFFNAAAKGMSLLLSFSFGVEENIRHFLNAELLSRVHPLRISIPNLNEEEALEFLTEVVGQAHDHSGEWPVSPGVIPAVVEIVKHSFDLTPRRLIKASGLVFESAEADLEDGVISTVTTDYVHAMRDNGDFARVDDKEADE